MDKLNRIKLNYMVDFCLTILFLIVAFTGLYMHFFIPSGVPRGMYVVYMGLTKATWLWIHNKSAILMTIIVAFHLILHWRWIVCTTRNFLRREKVKTEVYESVCESE